MVGWVPAMYVFKKSIDCRLGCVHVRLSEIKVWSFTHLSGIGKAEAYCVRTAYTES